MAWVAVALFVVSLVVSYAMMPKPQSTPPPALGDVKTPTAEEGREIPVLFGTRDIAGINILWYGDFKAVPVRKKGGKK